MTTLRATAGAIVRRVFSAMASVALLSTWAAPASAQFGGFGMGWGGL